MTDVVTEAITSYQCAKCRIPLLASTKAEEELSRGHEVPLHCEKCDGVTLFLAGGTVQDYLPPMVTPRWTESFY